jgi:hypothetical protein
MSATETAVPSIPDHELLRRVGRGSYGEVWLARGVTGAFRAVKIVHRRSFSSDRPYDREFNGILKFEPVSRTHPGLVSILHVGRNNERGHFYYVMEAADDVVSGRAIDPEQYVPKTVGAWLRQGPLPLGECIRVGLGLSDALAHLHAANLVHRDIKPSNIIFMDGLPKLADIGLVTDIGEKATFVGTEGYIPPEGPGSTGADVYGLGKVLYELSTGMSCDAFPELPEGFRQGFEGECFARFNSVVLKACDPRAAHRFTTALELHKQLLALSGAASPGIAAPTGDETQGRTEGARRVLVQFLPDEGRDARLACVVEAGLSDAGFEVLLDDRAQFGLAWARRMEREIPNATAVILLISEASSQDAILNYQLESAMRAIKPGRKGPLVMLVRMAFDGPLPVSLGGSPEEFRVGRWTEEGDDERLLTWLLEELAAESR